VRRPELLVPLPHQREIFLLPFGERLWSHIIMENNKQNEGQFVYDFSSMSRGLTTTVCALQLLLVIE
jgi:hypothetical protein